MTHPPTQTFWLERTDRVAVGLRRYRYTADAEHTCAGGYHSTLVFTGTAAAMWRDTEHGQVLAARHTRRGDPRWPAACRCGYQFTDDDQWQDWQEQLYQRADTGEIVSLRQHADDDVDAPPSAPPGASWDAWWHPHTPFWRGPDGLSLMVRLPDGHDWHVDGEATNCTRKGDHSHKCWVRTGDPRNATVTAGKTGGETCNAGGGSIASAGYHGFLVAGVLSAG